MTAELVPYELPLIAEYRTASFGHSLDAARARVVRRCSDNPRFRAAEGNNPWCSFSAPLAGRLPAWQLKLYVCVQADDYWQTVERLVDRFGHAAFPWKFYAAPDGYERPDKIVFYPGTPDRLAALIEPLRDQLAGCSSHPIRHAARTDELNLEAQPAGGLYVGSDPTFLDQSWRVYRTLAIAWAHINADYLHSLRGGLGRWLERMNLASTHEGPAALVPDPRDRRYVRRYWRMMLPEGLV